MLQKQYRLPARVRLKNASSFSTSHFLAKASNNNLTLSRFSFVISKKTAKRAVDRNRIRRIFRSCIEEMLPEIKPGRDVLFFLKKDILEIKREDLYNKIHTCLLAQKLLT